MSGHNIAFKELKRKYSLEVLEIKNVQVLKFLIWTTMLTLMVGIRIHNLVRNSTSTPGKMVRYTQLWWSIILA